MITVRDDGEWITVEGHAGYAERGHDIVCEAVSALTQTLIYSLQEIFDIDPEHHIASGYVAIRRPESAQAQVLVRAFLIGCKLLESAYGDYISCPSIDDTKSHGEQ